MPGFRPSGADSGPTKKAGDKDKGRTSEKEGEADEKTGDKGKGKTSEKEKERRDRDKGKANEKEKKRGDKDEGKANEKEKKHGAGVRGLVRLSLVLVRFKTGFRPVSDPMVHTSRIWKSRRLARLLSVAILIRFQIPF